MFGGDKVGGCRQDRRHPWPAWSLLDRKWLAFAELHDHCVNATGEGESFAQGVFESLRGDFHLINVIQPGNGTRSRFERTGLPEQFAPNTGNRGSPVNELR